MSNLSRRLNDSLRKLSIATTPQPSLALPVTYATGTVTDYTAGIATVDIDGNTLTVSHLYIPGYTPAVGDVVGVLLAGHSPIILSRIDGSPTY